MQWLNGLRLHLATEILFKLTLTQRSGGKIKVWVIYDYRDNTSIKAQDEYDCKKQQSRTLYLIGYSKSMGEGESHIVDQLNRKWIPLVPESKGRAMWYFACNYKS